MLQETQIHQMSPETLKEIDLFDDENNLKVSSEAYVYLHAVKWPYLEDKCSTCQVCKSQNAYDHALNKISSPR